MNEQDEHVCRMWSVVGSSCVWVAMWFLLEVCFKHMTETTQIFAYLAVLVVGLMILHRVSKKGYFTNT